MDGFDDLQYPSTDDPPKHDFQPGDARDLPVDDNSVDLIITSPPYFQKRDYGLADQIGQESTPEEYISSLMECLDEWERVLRDTGSIFLNVGDKYKNRSRMGIPWKLVQKARERHWRVRNEIIWHKPNGVPTSAQNRFTGRHETIFYLTPPNTDYYFDKYGYKNRYEDPIDVWKIPHDQNDTHLAPYPSELVERCLVAACPPAVCSNCGKPRERILEKSLTELNPDRYQSKRAMDIYEASDLTEEHIEAVRATGISDAGKGKEVQNGSGKNASNTEELAAQAKEVLGGYFREFTFSQVKTTAGWSECDCNSRTVPGRVLDPFCGSGTTVDVAAELGLSGIGVDLDPPERDNTVSAPNK
ncbi:DNA methyltransferase [Halohasta salina]|uniref:DNA methyltransferase n=1 Tax=Halohasta salina TaxID=2961621 RepID=UPI0020A58F69|nr:DNA methyltransferase [Halohasta salina]